MGLVLSAGASAAAQVLVEFAIEKIVEALSSETRERVSVEQYNFGHAYSLYELAEERKRQRKFSDAKATYYEAIIRLRQSSRNRRRELAHIHLCIAEIWLMQEDANHVIEECNQALEQLHQRRKKSDLPQIARALNLKCKALTGHSPKTALLFGLYAYAIEFCCYENGKRVIEFSNNLKSAWLKTGQGNEYEFDCWRANALKELSIQKGEYHGGP